MSQNHFQTFLDHENFARVHFHKKPRFEIQTLTLEQANQLAETLVCQASPENLTCDGELSHAQVSARLRQIRGAAAYLQRLFPDLTQPEWDDAGLFQTVEKVAFVAGQKVLVTGTRLGASVSGTILKINRVRARVDFGVLGIYNVPFGLMQKI